MTRLAILVLLVSLAPVAARAEPSWSAPVSRLFPTRAMLAAALDVPLTTAAPAPQAAGDPHIHRNLLLAGYGAALGAGTLTSLWVWQATLGPAYCYDDPALDQRMRNSKLALGVSASLLTAASLAALAALRAKHPDLRVSRRNRAGMAGIASAAASAMIVGFSMTVGCMWS